MIRRLRSMHVAAAIVTLLIAARAMGQTYYAANLDNLHAHHAPNPDAAGVAFLTLNEDRTRLSYSIAIEGLNLKRHPADRTEPKDILGIHLHLYVPDTIGPHVLNIFGLATYGVPAEEDADLVVDYVNNRLSGVYDISDASIDPATGQPYLQFFPLTSKLIDDWVDELDAGDLMFAVHTVASGFPTMAIHGRIQPIPEPFTSGMLVAGIAMSPFATRRGRLRRADN